MKLKITILIILAVVLILVVLGFLTRLPDNSQRKQSRVITDGESTSLGKAFKPSLQEYLSLIHI